MHDVERKAAAIAVHGTTPSTSTSTSTTRSVGRGEARDAAVDVIDGTMSDTLDHELVDRGGAAVGEAKPRVSGSLSEPMGSARVPHPHVPPEMIQLETVRLPVALAAMSGDSAVEEISESSVALPRIDTLASGTRVAVLQDQPTV